MGLTFAVTLTKDPRVESAMRILLSSRGISLLIVGGILLWMMHRLRARRPRTVCWLGVMIGLQTTGFLLSVGLSFSGSMSINSDAFQKEGVFSLYVARYLCANWLRALPYCLSWLIVAYLLLERSDRREKNVATESAHS